MVRRTRPGTYEHRPFHKLAEVCVPGFRALGLRPSPGMTGISDFLTVLKAGMTKKGRVPSVKFAPLRLAIVGFFIFAGFFIISAIGIIRSIFVIVIARRQ